MEKTKEIKPFFSIITCTYKPDDEILAKCLQSINKLNYEENLYEIIIVNNDNSNDLDVAFVRSFISETKNLKTIVEPKPGLTNARLKGLDNSKGQWIVFFDDDNEPHDDYLNNLRGLIRQYPEVAVWGPGNIYVKFMGAVPDYMNDLKGWYQEKHIEKEIYGDSTYFSDYYPAGTGMAVRRDVLLKYSELIRSGQLSATDRTGKNLTSGGDTQIVYTATKSGISVGIAPQLRLNHLISPEKATLRYLKKMIYGVYNTGLIHKESNPDIVREQKIPSRPGFYFLLAKKILTHGFRVWSPYFVVDLARYAGIIQSRFDIHEKKEFLELKLLKKAYKLI